MLRSKLGYSWALCSFELFVIVSLLLIFGFGPEKHGRSFMGEESLEMQLVVQGSDS
jgi:hypothetical protein